MDVWQEYVKAELLATVSAGQQAFAERCQEAARAFSDRRDPAAAMDILYELCEHGVQVTPILDLFEVGIAVSHLQAHDWRGTAREVVQDLKQRLDSDPRPRWADALLFLGHIQDGLAFYSKQPMDLVSANLLGVGSALMEDDRTSLRVFREALELPGYSPVEQVPVRYNLAQLLFWMHRLPESMVELKRCRSVYPHYRRVLKWIDQVRSLLERPWRPGGDGGAVALPVPYYSVTRAVAGGAEPAS